MPETNERRIWRRERWPGGSQYGYTLLSVTLVSNLFAIILQYLSLKLGIAAERNLAQAG